MQRITDASGAPPPPLRQPFLPLHYVPVVLREHGVAEAHAHPLVGQRRPDDSIFSWRTTPAKAWIEPLVEWTRTPISIVALGYDIDSRDALERLAATNVGCGTVPTPNLAIYRRLSGHALAIYTLRRPVLRGPGARPSPLAALGRCSEYLLDQLAADAGYAGVLASNPTHTDYDTQWLRREAYTLAELRRYIPHGWRRPRMPRTDAGRNCAIFGALMRFAGCREHTVADVCRYAQQLHDEIDVLTPHSFTASELKGIVSSVLRYRAQWAARGWHTPQWIARQAARGRRNTKEQQQRKGILSGLMRRERTRDRDLRILARLQSGQSIRAVAAAEGLPASTVQWVRERGVR